MYHRGIWHIGNEFIILMSKCTVLTRKTKCTAFSRRTKCSVVEEDQLYSVVKDQMYSVCYSVVKVDQM